ncbi:MAG: GTPase Era [Saprospiraceae bacterium]|nr:GTPase Era [Candidatus Brachybacter algidus]MBK8746839.1 GTPase Era [Candidatus Brachybacter algidus]
MNEHRSGFVNILGKPNAGKSTLLNLLIEAKLSITNRKAQTTRRRILGLWNDADHQIVFSDTPGIIDKPAYRMQEKMNTYIYQSFEDADVILYMADISDPTPWSEQIGGIMNKVDVPKLLIINKKDLEPSLNKEAALEKWPKDVEWTEVMLISALEEKDRQELLQKVLSLLPPGPEYYPKDQLSDLNERFFVADLIRKQILSLYSQEVPYSCEIYIDSFIESEKNGKPFAHVNATIFVSRSTQKSIIIGRKGEKIKQLGTNARKEIEEFLGYPIFLDLFVKVKENWRDDERQLNSFGY